MKIKYCQLCQRNVEPIKNFSWPMFLLFCLTGIGGIFYLIWYFLKGKKRCPLCNGKRLV